ARADLGPLVRLRCRGGREHGARVRKARERLAIDELFGALAQDLVERAIIAPRLDEEVRIAGVDDDVVDARRRPREHALVQLGARELSTLEAEPSFAVIVDEAVAAVDEVELGLKPVLPIMLHLSKRLV